MNAPEIVLPVHDQFISDSALYGRDPDGYCWCCSPRFANHPDPQYRIDSLITFGDCLITCDRCPYGQSSFDRQFQIGPMPLAAERKRHGLIQLFVIGIVEARGFVPPTFRVWSRDPQPQFWRHISQVFKRNYFNPNKVNFKQLKTQLNFREEWESVHGPAVNRTGKSWTTYCPFPPHDGLSMALYEDGYHCFGCQAHGDVIDVLRDSGRLSDVIRGAS